MLTARKLQGMEGVNNFLKGRLLGGIDLRPAKFFIHGKTLIFTTPSSTVTFTSGAGAQVPLSAKDILAQIGSQTANAVRAEFSRDGRLVVYAATPGVITVAANGTANADLGFPAAASTAAPINEPGGAAPEFVTLEAVGTDEDSYIVITNE
jgi:hypothetical protein